MSYARAATATLTCSCSWQAQSREFSTFSVPAQLAPAKQLEDPPLETSSSSESWMEWMWEAATGPGPADPFREDWKHWG